MFTNKPTVYYLRVVFVYVFLSNRLSSVPPVIFGILCFYQSDRSSNGVRPPSGVCQI